MDSTDRKARTVSCPGCKGPSLYSTDNPFRPFCSERCRNLDFGGWASERFRVGADPASDLQDAEAADKPAH